MVSREVAVSDPGIRTTEFERNLMFFLGLGMAPRVSRRRRGVCHDGF